MRSWPIGRTLTLLALVLQGAVLAVWSVRHPQEFATLTNTAKALWGAFVAVGAYLGIAKAGGKGRPFGVILSDRPVVAVVWTFAALTFAISYLSGPVHRVEIHAEIDRADPQATLVITPLRDSSETTTFRNSEAGIWLRRLRPGRYRTHYASMRIEGDTPFDVGWIGGVVTPQRVSLSLSLIEKFGTVSISSLPHGALLRIRSLVSGVGSDTTLIAGSDPTGVQLAPGSYWATASASGFVTDSATFAIREESETQVSLPLRHPAVLPATLDLRIQPAGLRILVDGAAQSATTPASFQIPPGAHLVRIEDTLERPLDERRGYYESLSLNLSAGGVERKTLTLTQRLLPQLKIADDTADARYVLHHAGDQIEVDFVQHANGIYLPPGDYTLERTLAGNTVSRPIHLSADRTERFP